MKRACLAVFILSGCGLDIVGVAEGRHEIVDTTGRAMPSEEALPVDDAVEMVAHPILTSRMAAAPAVVDLSAEGTIDWVHWVANRKAGANVIGEYRYAPDLLEPDKKSATTTVFKWNDGAPKKKGEVRTFESLSIPAKVRVTMQLPATTTKRTASFYLGGFRSTLRFEVKLSDGSIEPPIPLELSDEGGAFTQFVVEYAASREGVQLEVTYTLVEMRALDAALRMGAVTLQ